MGRSSVESVLSMSVFGLGEFLHVQNPVAGSGEDNIYNFIQGSDSRNLLMIKLCNPLKVIRDLGIRACWHVRELKALLERGFLNSHILCITP